MAPIQLDPAQCVALIFCQLPKSHSEAEAGPPSCAFGDCGQQWRHASNEMERMAENGTATFANPDRYQAGTGGASANLVITCGGDFKARLTWLKLRYLHVLRGSESLARIAYVSLSPARAFVSFPVGPVPATWGGLQLQLGDMVFHARGERTHQWTTGENQWGLLSLPLEQLAACGKALTGLEIISPPAGRVLRPSRSAATHLLRLHSKACRLAETRHELIEHPEVARALEQELLHALVNCLTADDADGNPRARRHHADIMVRFEDALAVHGSPQVKIPALCSAIGVPERTLRVCCAEFLGMSSYPVPFAAATEHGALGVAACRSGNGERRGDCPYPSVPRARALRCDVPHRVRGSALGYAAALADQNELIKIWLPKSHSVRKATRGRLPDRQGSGQPGGSPR